MTNWKPAVLTASAPSGEMTTWINPSAIEQLQREVDALKAPAAPTPVEDEVTEAEREYEPTYDMMQEGCEAYLNAVMQRADRAECDWDGLLAAYRAMRAARVPAPTPEPSAQPSEELRLLRELRDAVLNLGNARQWRERANQELVDIPVAPKECMALAIALAALDAAEGEGK